MRAMAAGHAGHGITHPAARESLSPKATWTSEERLTDMDALGI